MENLNLSDIISLKARSASVLPDISLGSSDVIDFTSGSPSAETFPLSQIALALQSSLSIESLQYCPDQGYAKLIQVLREWLQQWVGIYTNDDSVIITNGAQDAIAIAADSFLDLGDVILAESPSYWRAKGIFRNSGANVNYIPIHGTGIDLSVLEAKLLELSRAGKTVKMLYTIPNSQNPTGMVMSYEDRQKLLDLSLRYNLLIIEDDVYRGLSYGDTPPPPLFSLAKSNRVLYVGSLSAMLCPGLRIGWIVSSPQASEIMLRLKRDGGTNPFMSEVATHLFKNIQWAERFSFLREFYESRLESMDQALQKLPKGLVTWQRPLGGFHIWLQVNTIISVDKFESACGDLKVRVLSGSLCTGELDRYAMRLSFSNIQVGQMEEGIRRVGLALERAA